MRAAARAAGMSQPGPGASVTRFANSRPSREYRQVSSPRSASVANPSYRKTWPRAGAAPWIASGEFIASESTDREVARRRPTVRQEACSLRGAGLRVAEGAEDVGARQGPQVGLRPVAALQLVEQRRVAGDVA